MESREFADQITELIFNKKGYDVLIMDLRNLASFTDYFIICSADSEVQVKAVAEKIDKDLREKGIKCWHREGYLGLTWVLLDYVDVVVHIFKKDAREFYSLEKLWGDAPTDKVQDTISEQSTKAD